MKCDFCGTKFESGNRPDGLPNGVAFVQRDGTKITMCADCLIALGQMTDKEKDEFFKNIKK